MVVRIVKMTFKTENITSFRQIFEKNKESIASFDGCTFLELYQDKIKPEIFFTYSYWENENYLEQYRHSDFFKSVWSQTKVLFATPPEAWSLEKL
ncbi:antibiotic biosynthesis monooxygenase [Costertonia aggregata]|uniref:Antibiotic biosynthesis monooxygenase n=2 Tax=Costertonia aggregata TaxID=343403 RepID=A0A7H9ATQ1_9FLAO|nr:antibiotic biosynthesis monooxygenase family protein [Costertonia aggregata]QLG46722.1 antibiotic biosynthesis monooxygenase [Costertonia aggregata]